MGETIPICRDFFTLKAADLKQAAAFYIHLWNLVK